MMDLLVGESKLIVSAQLVTDICGPWYDTAAVTPCPSRFTFSISHCIDCCGCEVTGLGSLPLDGLIAVIVEGLAISTTVGTADTGLKPPQATHSVCKQAANTESALYIDHGAPQPSMTGLQLPCNGWGSERHPMAMSECYDRIKELLPTLHRCLHVGLLDTCWSVVPC